MRWGLYVGIERPTEPVALDRGLRRVRAGLASLAPNFGLASDAIPLGLSYVLTMKMGHVAFGFVPPLAGSAGVGVPLALVGSVDSNSSALKARVAGAGIAGL